MDELEQSDGPASGAATKHRKKVRLVASSRSGEWETERMGARLGVWKRKKGGLANGKTRGRWRWAGTCPGGPDTKNRGGEEATDRWGPVTVLAV
jgi:hypothetical protein